LPKGKVCQRQALYFSEINDSQKAGWCQAIDVVDGKGKLLAGMTSAFMAETAIIGF